MYSPHPPEPPAALSRPARPGIRQRWRYGTAGEGLALGGGALLPLAFAPFDLWPLAILLAAALLWLWDGVTPRRAAWRGGLFGCGAFATGIYWVYISLHDYGHAPAVFAGLTTLVLVLILALYPAVAGYVLARWTPRPGPYRWLLIAPALWAGLEWVRSWLFTGFPWLSLGYSQIDGPLAGLAPYLGVFGVGWAVLLSAGLLLALVQSAGRERWLWGALLGLLWSGAWGLGRIPWVEPAGEPLRVSLIQGNFSQDQKWHPEKVEEALERYTRLSLEEAGQSAVIVWPETAIPMFYGEVGEFAEALAEEARRRRTDYLIGVPAGSLETGVFYNAVVSLGSSHGFYYKRRLLPFGEYLPLRFWLNFFRHFVEIPMADFTPGGTDQSLLRAAGHPVGVSICFEAVFGSEIRLSLPQAHFLVNVSNDAWFGDSPAPHQHLQIARMRALEAGRFMVRATNTGISAIIDQRGRVIARSPQFQVHVLEGTVQPLGGSTPYGWWGDGAVAVLSGGLLALGWGLRRLGRAATRTRSLDGA